MDLDLIFAYGKPIAFHRYTSSVRKRIFEKSCHNLTKEEGVQHEAFFRQTESILIERFKQAGIDARPDNKIVFEMDLHGTRIFLGFYDWSFSIGFGVESDSWIKPVLPKKVI